MQFFEKLFVYFEINISKNKFRSLILFIKILYDKYYFYSLIFWFIVVNSIQRKTLVYVNSKEFQSNRICEKQIPLRI